MTTAELVELLERRVETLSSERAVFASIGDVDRVLALDADITATRAQLDDLTG